MHVVENVDGTVYWWMKPDHYGQERKKEKIISIDIMKEDFLIIDEPLECSYPSGNYVSLVGFKGQLSLTCTGWYDFHYWYLDVEGPWEFSVGKGIQHQSSILECIAFTCWWKRDVWKVNEVFSISYCNMQENIAKCYWSLCRHTKRALISTMAAYFHLGGHIYVNITTDISLQIITMFYLLLCVFNALFWFLLCIFNFYSSRPELQIRCYHKMMPMPIFFFILYAVQ